MKKKCNKNFVCFWGSLCFVACDQRYFDDDSFCWNKELRSRSRESVDLLFVLWKMTFLLLLRRVWHLVCNWREFLRNSIHSLWFQDIILIWKHGFLSIFIYPKRNAKWLALSISVKIIRFIQILTVLSLIFCHWQT